MKVKRHQHRGSSFDDFLKQEGIYEETCAVATKRILATQLSEELERQHKSLSQLAREMHTSRAAVNRLLDAKNYSVSLKTLSRLAAVLGKRLKLELVEG